MKPLKMTVTLPKIAAAAAAALALTATVLALPALAQAKTSPLAAPVGGGLTYKQDLLYRTNSGRTKLFFTSAEIVSAAGIKLERLTSPIAAGAYATLTVRTSRPATCSITVYYKGGPSRAAGLNPQRGTRIS